MVQRIALYSTVVPCDATNWTIECKQNCALALANRPKKARTAGDAAVKGPRVRKRLICELSLPHSRQTQCSKCIARALAQFRTTFTCQATVRRRHGCRPHVCIGRCTSVGNCVKLKSVTVFQYPSAGRTVQSPPTNSLRAPPYLTHALGVFIAADS